MHLFGLCFYGFAACKHFCLSVVVFVPEVLLHELCDSSYKKHGYNLRINTRHFANLPHSDGTFRVFVLNIRLVKIS